MRAPRHKFKLEMSGQKTLNHLGEFSWFLSDSSFTILSIQLSSQRIIGSYTLNATAFLVRLEFNMENGVWNVEVDAKKVSKIERHKGLLILAVFCAKSENHDRSNIIAGKLWTIHQ